MDPKLSYAISKNERVALKSSVQEHKSHLASRMGHTELARKIIECPDLAVAEKERIEPNKLMLKENESKLRIYFILVFFFSLT